MSHYINLRFRGGTSHYGCKFKEGCHPKTVREIEQDGSPKDLDLKTYACLHNDYLKEGEKNRVLWKSDISTNWRRKDIVLMARVRT